MINLSLPIEIYILKADSGCLSDNDQRFVRVFANIGNPVEQYFYRKLHLFLRLALKSLSHIYHESFDSDGIVIERQTLMLIERCIEMKE